MSSFFKRWKPGHGQEQKPEETTPQAGKLSTPPSVSSAQQEHQNAGEMTGAVVDGDDDLFGDMDLDFSSQGIKSGTHVETSLQGDQSNLEQLRDLVLTDSDESKIEEKSTSSKFDFIYQGQHDEIDSPTVDITQQQKYNNTINDDTPTTSTTILLTDKHKDIETDREILQEEKDVADSTVAITKTRESAHETTGPSTDTSTRTAPSKKKQPKEGRAKKTKKSRSPGSANKQVSESKPDVTKDKEIVTDTTANAQDAPTLEGEEERIEKTIAVSVTEGASCTETSIKMTEDSKREEYKRESTSEDNMKLASITLLNEQETKEACLDDQDEDDLFDDDMVMGFENVIPAPTLESKIEEEYKEVDVNEGVSKCEVVKDIKDNESDHGITISTIENDSLCEPNKQLENNDKVGNMTIELDEGDKFELTLETLKMKCEDLRNIENDLKTKRDTLISDWIVSKVDIDSIPQKVKELQEQQQRLAEQDEFDQAAAIEQESRDLVLKGERFKYQHPLLNSKISQMISDFKGYYSHHTEEKTKLLSSFHDTLSNHEDRIKSKDSTNDKEIQEQELQLKEGKLTADRKLSHLALDKDHLLKNKEILESEITKKTSSLLVERQVIVEKQTSVQLKLKELEEELRKLRLEDVGYCDEISSLDAKIDDFRMEFQPRLQKIAEEQKEISKQEENASAEMNEIDKKMNLINETKAKMEEKLMRDKVVLEDLHTNIKELENYKITTSLEDDNFLIENILDVKTFIVNDDETISDLKLKITRVESEYQSKFEEVLSDKSRLKSHQRCVKDLESQLAELQKAKKNAVKEKKYKDAKRLSDEIKTLTEEGENKQKEVLEIEESLKTNEMEMKSAHDQIDVYQKEYNVKLKEFDLTIVENLQQAQSKIKSFLDSNPETWFRNILELQISTDEEIINVLKVKHGMALDECDHEKLHEDLNKKLLILEQQREEAEMEENWDLAEELHNEITALKEKLEMQG